LGAFVTEKENGSNNYQLYLGFVGNEILATVLRDENDQEVVDQVDEPGDQIHRLIPLGHP
jgi:hypothetical protein